MLRKFIAKSLIAVFILSTVFTVNTYAGENDIPRMFKCVSPIYEMK